MRLIFLLIIIAASSQLQAENFAIKGRMVYTMEGEPIVDGLVLVSDGKISAVGRSAKIKIPAAYKVLEAEVVTPGFVDARSIVGISGAFNVTADQDHNELSDPNQAQLRAMDAYNPREILVDYVNSLGVTTLHVGPGRSNPIAGQSSIVKTHGESFDDVVVIENAAMIFNLGEGPKKAYGSKNKTPSTRMATVGLIRQALISAKNYARAKKLANKKGKPHKIDMKHEAMVRVLNKELKVFFMANRSDDIATAMRISQEYDLESVLDNATDAFILSDTIVKSGLPVVVHPTMQRPTSHETINTSLENAARLHDAGILIAIQSGTEGYVPKTRVLLWEAAIAHANGLEFSDTLAAITINPARILGIDDRVGSLKQNKDADVLLFSGNPFEYVTQLGTVITDGVISHQNN